MSHLARPTPRSSSTFDSRTKLPQSPEPAAFTLHRHTAWGEGRMANMFKGRPDWCVSRQRFWGVPIPVFYCQACNEAIADPRIIDHVADIFAKETADAWYARPESELLPEGFTCPKCN